MTHDCDCEFCTDEEKRLAAAKPPLERMKEGARVLAREQANRHRAEAQACFRESDRQKNIGMELLDRAMTIECAIEDSLNEDRK